MIRTFLFASYACASLSLVTACGGKVTFVEKGAGGAGGAGSTSTNATTTDVTTSVTTTNVTTGSGGSIQSECAAVCSAVSGQSCAGQGDCTANCVSEYQNLQSCQAQFKALIDCMAANAQSIVNCQAPSACMAALQAFTNCESMSGTSESVSGASGSGGGGCMPNGCSGSEASCDCAGTCFGQSYEISCKVDPVGVVCTCTENGMTHTCNNPSLSCDDVESNCCAQYFFAPD